ncbi:MAG: RluA family pseudouridine synthase [Chloroflexi bacterium]|nr:RluA family pseudouridine synthase [Chloroflexota bacterium]
MSEDAYLAPPPETEEVITLTVEQPGVRLDRYLAAQLPDRSRAEMQRWIKEGRVTVDGAAFKASYKLQAGERISVRVPEPETHDLLPEPIPLDVVYEDGDLLVINKPAGLVVHPAHGHWRGTLVNALLHRCPDLADADSAQRPGIVHRLDKDTSGLIVVAKNEAARQHLQAQFKARTVCKGYLALLEGHLEPREGRVEASTGRDPRRRKRMAVLPLARGGREAITHYRVLGYYDNYTLVEAEPKTGRTHQIRVHFAYINRPLVGDTVYGRRKQRLRCPRQFLHAHRLGFRLPSSGEFVEFTTELPADLQQVLDTLLLDENRCRKRCTR